MCIDHEDPCGGRKCNECDIAGCDETERCRECNGTGESYERRCSHCKGTGTEPVKKEDMREFDERSHYLGF